LTNSLLSSLNLPGSLQALEKPLGVPRAVLANSEEIRQQDGLGKIQRSLDDISKIRSNCLAMFDEACSVLNTETAEDEAARRKYGTDRWNRPDSATAGRNLNQQLQQYNLHFESARSVDEKTTATFSENQRILRLLAGPERDIADFIPNSRQQRLKPEAERQVEKLRSCLNEVSRMESRRRARIDAIRAKASADDIGEFTHRIFNRQPY
jgi:programmed cell death 6-interacting protein